MAEICILTDDTRLHRMLTLLVSEYGHTVGDGAPHLLITDKEELPERLCALPRIRIGKGGLSRPFSHAELRTRIEDALRETAHPLLTPTEKRLYDALLSVSPAPLDRQTLLRIVFGTEEDDGRLNLYIHYLRKKIETDGQKRIFAARGKGYYYDASHTRR